MLYKLTYKFIGINGNIYLIFLNFLMMCSGGFFPSYDSHKVMFLFSLPVTKAHSLG